MKTVLIIVLILLILFGFLVVSGKKNIRENKENGKCLTLKNYLLIKDSQYADELSSYRIIRNENELRFIRKDRGYTLFFLKLETNNVKLIGLDGYGIRDKEFLKYTCNLVSKILEMSSQNDNE